MTGGRNPGDVHGVLPVDKPVGLTSHDIVAVARRGLRTRRIGHTGTLDPFASGLLLLCCGAATRLAEYLSGLPKTYRATLRLGSATDTDDLSGEILRESDGWKALSGDEIVAALRRQVGRVLQLPPTFSAKRVGGERMYAMARRGEVPERTPVPVTIYRIEAVRVDLPEVEFEVECSSGTYVRAIARDVGEALGVGAHLCALRRTRVGEHEISGAIGAEALDDPVAVAGALLPPAAAVAHLPRSVLDPERAATLRHGGRVPATDAVAEAIPVALVAADGALLAIGERRGEWIHPRKVLA